MRGNIVSLYHGTNRAFSSFDRTRSRHVLNDGYWTQSGLAATRCAFFTSDRNAAERYAYAARNALIDRMTAIRGISNTLADFPYAQALFVALIDEGRDVAWGRYLSLSLTGSLPDHPEYPTFVDAGFDLNDLADIAEHVEGSKLTRAPDQNTELMSLFNGGSPSGLDDWVVDLALGHGIDCRPRILRLDVPECAVCHAHDRSAAERLIDAGAAVVRIPPDIDTVGGSDEILVSDDRLLSCITTEIMQRDYETPYEVIGNSSRGEDFCLLDQEKLSTLETTGTVLIDPIPLCDLYDTIDRPGDYTIGLVHQSGRLTRLISLTTLQGPEFTGDSARALATPLAVPDRSKVEINHCQPIENASPR